MGRFGATPCRGIHCASEECTIAWHVINMAYVDRAQSFQVCDCVPALRISRLQRCPVQGPSYTPTDEHRYTASYATRLG